MAYERKFTTDVKEKLLKNIEQEDKHKGIDDWYVFDFISDELDINSIKYTSNDADSYYAYIVDKKNSSAKEIEQIWTDVGKIDYDYSFQYKKTKEFVDTLKKKVDLIAELVQSGSKFKESPEDFSKLFNDINGEIEMAKANHEKEKLVIHNPDGSTDYNWELYKDYMNKGAENVTKEQYEALLGIYRDMMKEKDYANIQKMFEESYILEDGIWRYGNGNFRKHHLSDVFKNMSAMYTSSMQEILNEKIPGTEITPAQLMQLEDSQLEEIGGPKLVELKHCYMDECLSQSTMSALAKQMPEVFDYKERITFDISEEQVDYGDRFRTITISSDAYSTTENGNSLITYADMQPLDNIKVYDFRAAKYIDKISDNANKELMESLRQDVIGTNKSDVQSAVISFTKCEIVTNVGEKIGLELGGKVAGTVGSKVAGVLNAGIDCAVTIIEDDIAANFTNSIIDKCKSNTDLANILDLTGASANVTYANGRITVTNMVIDKKYLNEQIKRYGYKDRITADQVEDYIRNKYNDGKHDKIKSDIESFLERGLSGN